MLLIPKEMVEMVKIHWDVSSWLHIYCFKPLLQKMSKANVKNTLSTLFFINKRRLSQFAILFKFK